MKYIKNKNTEVGSIKPRLPIICKIFWIIGCTVSDVLLKLGIS